MRPINRPNFDLSPLLVFYELTRACDLACQHCRACAQPRRHPRELSLEQIEALIADLCRFPQPPLLVLTGGDPLKRPEIDQVVRLATQAGLKVALTPSATQLVTRQRLAELQAAGVQRLAISLDSADAAIHDAFRGVPGSFDRSLQILADARALGLPVQVNTTLCRRNAWQLEFLADELAQAGIAMWSVFFLIPLGRGLRQERLPASLCELAFARLWQQARKQPYVIKTTEAPHYRRFVLQQVRKDPKTVLDGEHGGDGGQAAAPGSPPFPLHTLGVNDGKGVLFISHTGQIFPSGFLPIECGRFPRDRIVETYQQQPLFRQLRDPDQLHGKCGRCEFRTICGGSRARSYAVTGDPLGAEPDCLHQPDTVTMERSSAL